jgi:acetylglutamate kinase
MQAEPEQDVSLGGEDEALEEAMPYLRALQRQTVVIVCNGHALRDFERVRALTREVAFLSMAGVRPLLLHDAGMGLRDLTQHWVQLFNQSGIQALGISGTDLQCAPESESTTQARCPVRALNSQLVALLLGNQLLPVINASASDSLGVMRLLCAEQIGSLLASALSAFTLIFMGDGEMLAALGEDVHPGELARRLKQSPSRLGAATAQAALDALAQGVKSVHLIDASEPYALTHALLSEEDHGLTLCSHHAAHWLADSNRYFYGADSLLRSDFQAQSKRVVRF